MQIKKILLVEDLPEKAEEIKNVIASAFSDVKVEERSSYHSAIEEIYRKYSEYFLILLDIPIKVKIVTMYESFDGKSISALDHDLREDNPDCYDGYIFFSFKKSDWKQQLVDYIKSKI